MRLTYFYKKYIKIPGSKFPSSSNFVIFQVLVSTFKLFSKIIEYTKDSLSNSSASCSLILNTLSLFSSKLKECLNFVIVEDVTVFF
jgi:hypothetical protein